MTENDIYTGIFREPVVGVNWRIDISSTHSRAEVSKKESQRVLLVSIIDIYGRSRERPRFV